MAPTYSLIIWRPRLKVKFVKGGPWGRPWSEANPSIWPQKFDGFKKTNSFLKMPQPILPLLLYTLGLLASCDINRPMEVSLKFPKKLMFGLGSRPRFWGIIMFRECSSGVGTPDLGEMKGRRPTYVGQKTRYQAFESTISMSSKTHFLCSRLLVQSWTPPLWCTKT